jgi:pilus assembly protein Flp/PilA
MPTPKLDPFILRYLQADEIVLADESLQRSRHVTILKQFLSDESGATAVEYGLIATVISLVVIGGGNSVWVAIKDKFIFLGNTVKNG